MTRRWKTPAAEIAAALGGRREGRQWRCRCPIHGGRSLFACGGEAGRILIFCHGGCEARDVLAELRRSGLLGGPSENYPFPAMHRNHRIDEAARRAWALAIWRQARPAAGTIVDTYLANRGLAASSTQYLRLHPACPHPSGANLPAMIGLVEHVNHGPIAIHRTFISADGSGKAGLTPDKASLGPVAGGAVRLAQVRADQWLLVAEGLETTFSVMHACELPGWAALSAGGIESLVLPPFANMVVICADNDANGVGQRAAKAAAERFLAEGRRVRIALPPTSGIDFNDLLRGSASARVEETPLSSDPRAIRAIVEQAEELRGDPPRPLTRQIPPADLFPIDALGGVLGSAACAIHDRVQAPLAICGQSVLATAALAVQGHADVELPMGHIRPVSEYFVTVAETGARKSACDTGAAWPIRKREHALRETRDAELPNYFNDKTAWEKA